MSERSKHSKIVIASTILPIAVWIYIGLLGLIVTRKNFLDFLNRIFGDSLDALGVVFILAIFLFGIIPIAGHLAGLVCGIIGLFPKTKNESLSLPD